MTTAAFDEAWFSQRAQAGVRALRAYDPGHDLVALRQRFGESGLLELGSNENPYGPSPDARAAILDALHGLHRYPDPRGDALKQALGAVHGVEKAQVLLGNGSHELLMQLAQVFAGPGSEVVFSHFGFAVFAIATQATGATACVVSAAPPDASMPLGHDLDAMARAITERTSLVFLANPNSPTGTWFGPSALEDFLQRVPPRVIVVVDEAYAEMADPHTAGSALTLLARFPNVVVTRTFSKAYALAGLRVGYLIAAPALVAVMERVRESFNVNALGLAAAAAALRDVAHLEWSVARNRDERSTLAAALSRRGFTVLPSQTNFLLATLGERTAGIEDALLERGGGLPPMRGHGLPG